MKPVVVQEKMEFKANFTSYARGRQNGNFIPEEEMFLKLQRNIADDTFNVMVRNPKDHYDLKDPRYTNRRYGDTSKVTANVNGKNYLGQVLQYAHDGADGIKADGHSYFIHHGMLSDAKLREVKNITVTDDFDRNRGTIFSVFPKFRELKQFVSLKENEYLDIQTLNGVVFDVPKKYIATSTHPYKIPDSGTKKYYNHTFIVPRKISRLEHNKTLYDIYSLNEIDRPFHSINRMIGLSDVYPDVLLRNGSMASSAISKKMHIYPTKNSNNDIRNFVKDSSGPETNKPVFIGSFEISDHSGFNYEKGASEFGPSSDSKEGELIPYNYEGSYSRTTTLGINEIYKKINIIQSLDKTQPVLHPDSGRFMLSVYQSKLPVNTTWKTIDQKLFKKESKYIYPLLGLERLADLTERRKNEEAI